MFTLNHRTVALASDSVWEFDPARRVVDMVIRLESGTICFALRVCAPDRASAFAHPVMRLDGEAWQILPAVFIPKDSPDTEVTPVTLRSPVQSFLPRECTRSLMPLQSSLKGWPRFNPDAISCPLHRAIGGSTHLVLLNAPSTIDAEMEELAA